MAPRSRHRSPSLVIAVLPLWLIVPSSFAQAPPQASPHASAHTSQSADLHPVSPVSHKALPAGVPVRRHEARFAVCPPCIRSDMNFLAADALRGRGSATRDEQSAALFAAALFANFGLVPGGDQGGYLQTVPLPASVSEDLRSVSHETGRETWNVIGSLPGSDPVMRKEAVLLTAHLDHLGVGPPKNGDAIYNGADDDASGITAVLELARALANRTRPKRTILFVLFGSEEIGGFGNRYFLAHPPLPLNRIVAALEFEMIGRPDPMVGPRHVWMTGFERSDLGPELERHGAPLVADPRPTENFFQRSDNYDLARSGVIAQTVSSFGLHADYHQPSDELDRIDFAHMDAVITSMAAPIGWLANTRWRPAWRPGGRP